MAFDKYAKRIAGKKHKNILLFTLSTCVWCKHTKDLLKKMGYGYRFIDVDRLPAAARPEVEEAIARWNKKHSFPTIVVDNKRCIVGFDEQEIRKL